MMLQRAILLNTLPKHGHLYGAHRCFSTKRGSDWANSDKISIEQTEDDGKKPQLSFLKNNPLLSAVSKSGRTYGGVKDSEDVRAEDLDDIMQRSDMRK